MFKVSVCGLATMFAVLSWGALRTLAFDDFNDVITIKTLPKSDREAAAAFRGSEGDACEQLPKGEALEVRALTATLTMRDRLTTKTKVLPSARYSIFSVGLEFQSDDRADLPMVSGGLIASYLNEHCVLIQARLRKDLLDRKMYYHHRPLAVTSKYRSSGISIQFDPVVASNIRNFHGIGLFVGEEKVLKAETLRTMVLIFRNNVLIPESTRAREQFEFVFVRGRDSKLPDRMDHHVFVTANDRQTLYYVTPYFQPSRPAKCTILGRIAITKYDSTGLYPKESATRSFRIDSRAKFQMPELEEYCKAKQLTGGFHSNLNSVLDAIIDRKISHANIAPVLLP